MRYSAVLPKKISSILPAAIVPGARYRVVGFGWWDVHRVRAEERGLLSAVWVADPSEEGYASEYTENQGFVRGQFRQEDGTRFFFFTAAQLERM